MGCVLVIDDDRAIARLLGRALGRQHQVVVVANGSEAVARVAEGERFDVVLCDINMPDLDGPGVYAALRRIDAEQARRIVFLSGTMRPPAGLPCRFLAKPVDLATLLAVVDGFLPVRLAPQSGPPDARSHPRAVPADLQDALSRVFNADAGGDLASSTATRIKRIEVLREARSTFGAWREGRVATEQAIARLHALAETMEQ